MAQDRIRTFQDDVAPLLEHYASFSKACASALLNCLCVQGTHPVHTVPFARALQVKTVSADGSLEDVSGRLIKALTR